VWPILGDACLKTQLRSLSAGNFQTNLAELYAPQLARLHGAFITWAAFQGCPDSADGIFFSPLTRHCQSATVRLWSLHMVGQNADVGRVIRAEQPRTHPIKKAIFCHLGRFLKLYFQLIFSFDVPRGLWKTRQAFWAR
jgi:hypothetical protein